LCVAAVSACGTGSSGTDAGDVADDGGFDVPPPDPPAPPDPPVPPVLTPCPEGWVEAPPEEPDGVATCDPWPDGDPAALPVLTPCPDGWREVTDPDLGIVTCDPWPEGGAEECAAVDGAHFPGEAGCTRVGAACTGDPWASDLPSAGTIRFVLAGAAAGGTGARASPFATIGEAVAGASAGTVVAVSKGTFDEEVLLPAGVTLWGACVAETVIAPSSPDDESGAVVVRTPSVTIRNLRVSGAHPGILVSGSDAHLDAFAVVVSGADGRGIWVVDGAAFAGDTVVVRGTVPRATDGQLGRGIDVRRGATATLRRAVLQGNHDTGLLVSDAGSVLSVTDAAVLDTRPSTADATSGNGIWAQAGGRAEGSRLVVDRAHNVAVVAFAAGASLRLEDLVVRDTLGPSATLFGRGMELTEGASAEITRALFDRNELVGASAWNAGSALSLTDTVIRDTSGARTPDGDGWGLMVREGAHIEGTRVGLARNTGFGVVGFDRGSTIRLEDVTVAGTSPVRNGTLGHGLNAQGGARAEVVRGTFRGSQEAGISAIQPDTLVSLDRVRVEDTAGIAAASGTVAGYGIAADVGATVRIAGVDLRRSAEAGIYASGPETTIDGTDLVVRDTLGRSDHYFGRGIHVELGASVTLDRVLLERNREVAAFAALAGAHVGLSHVVIRDTASSGPAGSRDGGRAFGVQDGAHGEVHGALIVRNRDVAVFADGLGASLALSNVRIQDTRSREFDRSLGRGLGVQNGARVTLDRSRIERNLGTGIFVGGENAELTLADVVVADTLPQESDGLFGRAITVQSAGRLVAERLALERNLDVSLIVVGPGTTADLTDLLVDGTLARPSDGAFGSGIVCLGGAHVDVHSFAVTHNALCGIQLAFGADLATGLPFTEGGTMDLYDGEVAFNTVCGANVQTAGFDLRRLQNNVRWHDNGVDLDTRELPVPAALDGP
jgi:hypothetical protein